MIPVKIRNSLISVFAAAWLVLFNYESLRYNYLSPLVGFELPKFKFLFPPAGWIMFFQVDEVEGRAEVYGLKGERFEYIDPHRIFDIRWIGYDNIRRNVLISALHGFYASSFCLYLKRKFPEYDGFTIMQVIYPSNIKYPGKKIMRPAYEC